MFNIKKSEKKPYQFIAWLSTLSILIGLLAITAFLWKENSLLVLNSGLFLIYVFGTYYEYI